MTAPTPDKTTTGSTPPAKLTPAMRQFFNFKNQYPDCVLFFRMGDFYEMFHDDAITAHKALGITLTQRSEGVPMAGVPYHSVDGYLQRMIAMGYRVAVCDQVQDPKEAKGVVDRAVTRVLTPGTLVDESLLDESSANRIAAVQFVEAGDDSAAAIAVIELSTGAHDVAMIPQARLVDELARLRPSELLYAETADGLAPPRVERLRQALSTVLTPRPTWTFRSQDALDLIREQFGVKTLTGFGLSDDDPCVGPCGALIRYLIETQSPDQGLAGNRLAHLQPPRRLAADDHMLLDATTLRSLEVERTMRSGSTDGAVVSVFPHCRTAMGKRLLRHWLCFPLKDLERINTRQSIVAAFVADRTFAEELGRATDDIHDVARIATRVVIGRATPRDVVALGRSIGQAETLTTLLEGIPSFRPYHTELADLVVTLQPLAEHVNSSCIDQPPAHMREGGLFQDGVDAELDEARDLQRNAKDWLARYQATLADEVGIPSMKVGYNKVFGYYIEITRVHSDKVPDTFSRKQTLKNAERYITPELKEFEEKILTADSRAIEREKQLFDVLCARIAAEHESLNRFAAMVAELDVLQCFAETASRRGYTRPEMCAEPVLDIEQGRHPVLDTASRSSAEAQFVPNDAQLGLPDDESRRSSLAIITGPNMAGKSTYIRQVALITLLAHTGSFVPAERARIGLTDRIFTRIGASDELHTGQSTFMVEMTETSNILHHATAQSLVILDEIGRGTSTLDGLSLAWAIAESLAEVGCRTMFATHYHELTTLADRLDAVTNLHVSVREWGDSIVFLYRILPGRTDRSYGIHVARLAGLPPHTIARAQQLLDTLAVQTESPTIPGDAPLASNPEPPRGQMSLFTEYVEHPAVDRLRSVDLVNITPLDAFSLLREIQGELDHESTTD